MTTSKYDSLNTQLQESYWKIHGTQMQEQLWKERANQYSTVYFGFGGYDVADLESEFRRMVDLGFNAVRFYTANPKEVSPGKFDFSRPDDWMDAAERAGIGVIFHTEWFPPSNELLAHHGLNREAYMNAYADDISYIAVLKSQYQPLVERYKNHPALSAWGTLGEPDPAEKEITSDVDKQRFGQWLKEKHKTIKALNNAWNVYPEPEHLIVDTFDEAWKVLAGFHGPAQISGVHRALFNYGAGRDMREFLTEKALDRGEAYLKVYREIDTLHPVLTGSHQLFCNQASHRWDSDRWAKLGDCFTTSIHLAWHFDLVEGEVARPVYMQARQTRDWFKGGWTSCYETTGGPVQYSGGYGNSMSPGLMRQLILNYLAAGNINFSFWVWNGRPGGWEAGEYSLTSLSGKITPWAEEAGRLVRIAKKYKDELWKTGFPPEVGILSSWDTDAILEMEPPRHDLVDGVGLLGKGTLHQAARARIGASRAFINNQISFEYVTEREILDGIGKRYPIIYAPHLRSISDRLFEALLAYTEAGGILIADVQFGFLDSYGKLRRTGSGKMHDKLFGSWFENIHDARTGGPKFKGKSVSGFFADMEIDSAVCVETFDSGAPALSAVSNGEGLASLLAFDPAHETWKPSNGSTESFLADLIRRHIPAEWKCTHSLTYRLRTSDADHFFLINEGDSTDASFEFIGRQPIEIIDVIENKRLAFTNSIKIQIPGKSGAWIRVRY